MKKILFAVIAIVFPVIVMAQGCPVPTTVTATVTFKRNNISPALNGIFTIDAGGTTVKFSKGNLQYKPSMDIWQFAAHQYDIIGADNASISSSYDDWIDLFGWATAGNSASGTHYMPWDASTDDTYGNAIAPEGGDNLDAASDWGSRIGSGWRTLTSAEWTYLLSTRAGGTIAVGTNARWAPARILTNGSGVEGIDYNICGIILIPDGYEELAAPTGVTWHAASINGASNISFGTTCTTDGWTTLEDAGCIFLPCAGQRNGTTVSNVATYAYYWSATSNNVDNSIAVNFPSWNIVFNFARHLGYSVRLVQVQ